MSVISDLLSKFDKVCQSIEKMESTDPEVNKIKKEISEFYSSGDFQNIEYNKKYSKLNKLDNLRDSTPLSDLDYSKLGTLTDLFRYIKTFRYIPRATNYKKFLVLLDSITSLTSEIYLVDSIDSSDSIFEDTEYTNYSDNQGLNKYYIFYKFIGTRLNDLPGILLTLHVEYDYELDKDQIETNIFDNLTFFISDN